MLKQDQQDPQQRIHFFNILNITEDIFLSYFF
jgi:hypothetical protein